MANFAEIQAELGKLPQADAYRVPGTGYRVFDPLPEGKTKQLRVRADHLDPDVASGRRIDPDLETKRGIGGKKRVEIERVARAQQKPRFVYAAPGDQPGVLLNVPVAGIHANLADPAGRLAARAGQHGAGFPAALQQDFPRLDKAAGENLQRPEAA